MKTPIQLIEELEKKHQAEINELKALIRKKEEWKMEAALNAHALQLHELEKRVEALEKRDGSVPYDVLSPKVCQHGRLLAHCSICYVKIF